jgi:hypothetical protein
MKTYEQTIDFMVDDATIGAKQLRYHEWAGQLVIAEIYGVTMDQVVADIARGVSRHHAEIKAAQKAQRQLDHNLRRESNLVQRTFQPV